MQEVKSKLREKMLAFLSDLEPEYKQEADASINKHLQSMPAYKKADTIFVYASMNDEVDTWSFIKESLELGKVICTPRCVSKGIMHAYQITSIDDLEDGHFGTKEPKESCPKIEPADIDFAIIPCVAADKNGYRLGYGGGFYDRYLKDQQFPTAVICREKGLLEEAPKEDHDLQLDYVVTEKEIITT